jgi:hypothetical protein
MAGRMNLGEMVVDSFAGTVAALFVERGGVYWNLPGVDAWDKERDARLYAGPHPVVAHPPCERWGRYWFGSPYLAGKGIRLKKGDDSGCFASAIASVRRWGGVLEHPEGSHAWLTHGLFPPAKSGGWHAAGDFLGWTCCVEQGHYGHRARKATWLYVCAIAEFPSLRWGKSAATAKLEDSFRTAEEGRRRRASPDYKPVARLSHYERLATPLPFRDLLLGLARSCRVETPR